MKVIDLLNKIASGEEIPEKIEVRNYIWTYEESFKQYKNDNLQELVKYLLGYYQKEGCCFTVYGALNCEVEVIEDNNIDIEEIETYSEDGVGLYDKNSIHFNRKKINELVRKYNELNREIKELKEK